MRYTIEHVSHPANKLPYGVKVIPEQSIAQYYHDIQHWLRNHNIDAVVLGGNIYFETEQDATFFIMGYNHE